MFRCPDKDKAPSQEASPAPGIALSWRYTADSSRRNIKMRYRRQGRTGSWFCNSLFPCMPSRQRGSADKPPERPLPLWSVPGFGSQRACGNADCRAGSVSTLPSFRRSDETPKTAPSLRPHTVPALPVFSPAAKAAGSRPGPETSSSQRKPTRPGMLYRSFPFQTGSGLPEIRRCKRSPAGSSQP